MECVVGANPRSFIHSCGDQTNNRTRPIGEPSRENPFSYLIAARLAGDGEREGGEGSVALAHLLPIPRGTIRSAFSAEAMVATRSDQLSRPGSGRME